jgi:hypothetical protein
MNRTQTPAPAARLHRRIVLIDVENANGGPVQTPAEAQWVHRVLTRTIGLQNGDQVVLACNRDRTSIFNIFFAWGESPRIVTGYGRSGADKALISVMHEDLPGRFAELVLVSGDKIFAKHVAALAARGLPTRVLSLRIAATSVEPIVSPLHPTPLQKAA